MSAERKTDATASSVTPTATMFLRTEKMWHSRCLRIVSSVYARYLTANLCFLDTPTGSVRLDFTRETPSEAADITRAYAVMTRNNGRADSSVKSFMAKMDKKLVTKGHFFRGVE